MLLVNINRKPYMRIPIVLITFDLSDLERSVSRSLGFGKLISHEGAKIGHTCTLLIKH